MTVGIVTLGNRDSKLGAGMSEVEKMIALAKAKSTDWEKALKRIKTVEFDRGRLFLITHDMLKLIVSWSSVPRGYRADVKDTGESESAWGMVHYDVEDWVRLSGVGMDTYKLHMIVRDLGMVYPDGTVPKEVKEYIDAEVDAMLGRGDEPD